MGRGESLDGPRYVFERRSQRPHTYVMVCRLVRDAACLAWTVLTRQVEQKGFKCSGGVKSQCGIAWKAGDIVGLAVDLSGTGSIMVSVNGKDEMPCGVIFSDLSHAGVIEGVFPACSLMPGANRPT